MRRPWLALPVRVFCLSLLACGAPSDATTEATTEIASGAASSGSSGSPTGSTGSTGTTGTTGTTGSTTTGGSTFLGSTDPTEASFIINNDMVNCGQCDNWLVESCCVPDQKCVPYAAGRDSTLNAVKCVALDRDPVPVGGLCTSGGSASGIDDCALGAICWYVDLDTLEGTCVALCNGNVDAPDCSHVPGTSCMIDNDGLINLCLPPCDPLAQDCPLDETCIPAPKDHDVFVCAIDASGDEGQAFDPCAWANVCDLGLYCGEPEAASECDPDEPGCCLAFCDIDDPLCPGVDQQCVPWFEPGAAPMGLEKLGGCALP
jgi:hypothetical protein